MTFLRRHWTLLAVAITCGAGGAAISAIASAGAATGRSGRAGGAHWHARRRLGFRRVMHRAVHGQVVVATPRGFQTLTFDRGWIQSVSGQQLTLREGTKNATYKTVTLTIPSTARVRDNGQLASITDVKPGQRAIVVQAPLRTIVIARTPQG